MTINYLCINRKHFWKPVHVLRYQILKYIWKEIIRHYFQYIKRSIYQAFCIIVLEWFIFQLCVKYLISFRLKITSLKLENVVIHLAEKTTFWFMLFLDTKPYIYRRDALNFWKLCVATLIKRHESCFNNSKNLLMNA